MPNQCGMPHTHTHEFQYVLRACHIGLHIIPANHPNKTHKCTRNFAFNVPSTKRSSVCGVWFFQFVNHFKYAKQMLHILRQWTAIDAEHPSKCRAFFPLSTIIRRNVFNAHRYIVHFLSISVCRSVSPSRVNLHTARVKVFTERR